MAPHPTPGTPALAGGRPGLSPQCGAREHRAVLVRGIQIFINVAGSPLEGDPLWRRLGQNLSARTVEFSRWAPGRFGPHDPEEQAEAG